MDQYYAQHPAALFAQPPEPVALDPDQPDVMRMHLCCAAHEWPLAAADVAAGLFGPGAAAQLSAMAADAVPPVVAVPVVAAEAADATDPALVWCHVQSAAALTTQRNRTGAPCPGPGDGPCASHRVSLRAISDAAVTVIRADTLRGMDTLPLRQAYLQAFPGAIYFHQGETYLIVSLDVEACAARAVPIQARVSSPLKRNLRAC